jgi:hypothetical protein
MMSPGEEKAWSILLELEPEEVCRNAKAVFDEKSRLYRLESFGMNLSISPAERSIGSSSQGSDLLLQRLGYFANLSTVWYMVGARDIPFSGNLVNPLNLRGGQLFFRGTHVLPLDKISLRYSGNLEGFLKRGKELGAQQAAYGDASLVLFPFPRVPVYVIIWKEDEEFPARSDLLFDSSCEHHLALDMLWSTAMMSLLILL